MAGALCPPRLGPAGTRAAASRADHKPPAGALLAEAPREVLARLYHGHAARVLRWAARLGGPWVDAEDVVQEVFCALFRQLERFRGDARVTTWLFAITRNIVADRISREQSRRSLLGRRCHEMPAAYEPFDDLERRHSMRLVYEALAYIPEKYRVVFVLFDVDGLTGPEIEELTGTNVNTLRVRLMRARALFAARFARLVESRGGA